ncbi:MAG: hypothetical protein IJ258_10400 [Methanobrevibacter sp.]|uniref:hypothetical protein n=1 Tax=Methanobrevibacter sp. TaxID=66852 RepID=UPI0025EBF6C8|nr:hypothetical protein [Methanobrevibacter sp.]MBQ8018495.1 hypothetical protein [Methanobrevibacter sp.]
MNTVKMYNNGNADGFELGIGQIIKRLLEFGEDCEVIAQKTKISLEKRFLIKEKK